MHTSTRHIVRDGLKIGAVMLASFGIFYFAMAQSTIDGSQTVPGPVCGNGSCEVERGETATSCPDDCRTANRTSTDGSTATTTACGDGMPTSPEECDKGAMNGSICTAEYSTECAYCSKECRIQRVAGPFCGDGTCQTQYEGPANCEKDCPATAPSGVTQFCGDGVTTGSEQCDEASKNGVLCPDPGYGARCQYCSSACLFEIRRGAFCGDRMCQSDKENSSSCATDCQAAATSETTIASPTTTTQNAVCGDNVRQDPEGCDEGSKNGVRCAVTVYGETCRYCTASCALETALGPRCGDRVCQTEKESPLTCSIDCGSLPAACVEKRISTVEACEKYLAELRVAQTQGSSVTVLCGNLVCEAESGETPEKCPTDCARTTAPAPTPTPTAPQTTTVAPKAVCGNGSCESALGETALNCVRDCPATSLQVPTAPAAPTAPASPTPAGTDDEDDDGDDATAPPTTTVTRVELPELCRLKNVTDLEECRALVTSALLRPAATTAAVTTDSAVTPATEGRGSDVLTACTTNGATTAEQCKALVAASSVSEECRAAGVFDDSSCKALLATTGSEATFVPEECRASGVFTRAACETYLHQKYAVSAPTEVSTECAATGVTDAASCKLAVERDYFPSACTSQGITDSSVCARYLSYLTLPDACRAAGKSDTASCTAFLRISQLDPICQAQGIADEAACTEYVYGQVAPAVTCRGITGEQCAIALKTQYLPAAVTAKNAIERKAEAVAAAADDEGSVDMVALKVADAKTYEEVHAALPLRETLDVRWRALASEARLSIEDGAVRAGTSVLAALDSDGDGAPDDVESRNGLDPYRADSDGDGTGDLAELKALQLAGIDRAVADGRSIGQPIGEGETDEALTVRLAASERTVLSGTGVPGEVVTLYVYTDMPLVVTTTVDANGQWNYELGDALKDGPHEVYVAINDDEGRVTRKSEPLALLIQGASAVTAAQAATQEAAAQSLDAQILAQQDSPVKANLTLFIFGGLALVAVALLLVAAIMRQRTPPVA